MRNIFPLVFTLCLCWSGCQRTQHATESSAKGLASIAAKLDSAAVRSQVESFLRQPDRIRGIQQLDSAQYYYERLKFLEGHLSDEEWVEYLVRFGEIASNWDQFTWADSSFERALSHQERYVAPPEQIARLYIRLADTKMELKDFTTASSYLEAARREIEKNLPNDEKKWGDCIGISAGLHYYHGEFREAIAGWQDALRHYNLAGVDRPRYHANIGHAYASLKDMRKAVHFVDIAIKRTIAQGSDQKILGDLYLAKGSFLQQAGQLDSALLYFNRMEIIRRQVFGRKGTYPFGASYTVGLYFRSVERHDSAAARFHKSLTALIKGFESADLSDNPKPRASECNTDLFLGLREKGISLYEWGRKSSNPEEKFSMALEALLLADSVINVFRRNSFYDDSQLTVKDSYPVPYETMLDLSYNLYQSTRNKKFLNVSLRIMESSRAALLQDALRRINAFGESGLSEDLKERDRQLTRKRAELLLALDRKTSGEDRRTISDKLLEIDRQERTLQWEIDRINPNYRRVRFSEPLSDLSALRVKVPSQTTFLEYLWGEHSIYLLALDEKGEILKKIDRDSEFESSFRQFLFEVTNGGTHVHVKPRFKEFSSSAYYLYEKLLREHLEDFPASRLVISANGPLAMFPFNALITSPADTSEINYRLSYLVRNHTIAQTYSAGMLNSSGSRRNGGQKLVAFGYGKTSSSAGLPGTEKEILSIRRIMRNPSNRFLLDEHSTEAQFKGTIPDFNIAHLAVHGAADTTNSLKSRLLFRTDNGATEDGVLYAHELYGLDLDNLELAVLSACESGIGKVQDGEGVMSIARGFVYAGCPSVIMSLWKVNDDTSSELMSEFYQRLAQGGKVDESLTQAMRGYLDHTTELNGHPSRWAAFMAIGSMSPFSADGNPKWWLLAGMLVTAVVCFLWWRFRPSGKSKI